jgi:hypothetical protein
MTFQIKGRARDLTMFNLAIDSKLRGSNLAHERPLCARSGHPKKAAIDRFCRKGPSWGNERQFSETLTRVARPRRFSESDHGPA